MVAMLLLALEPHVVSLGDYQVRKLKAVERVFRLERPDACAWFVNRGFHTLQLGMVTHILEGLFSD